MGGKLSVFPSLPPSGEVVRISNFAEVQKTPLRRQKQRGRGRKIIGSSRKVWGANKDLGEAPKSCTRKEHESATNSIARRGQGANCPLQGQGTASLVGFGATPQLFRGRPASQGRAQQRCRQRSVPASNFARPQTRPQAALPPRFREEPKKPPKHSRVSEEERCIYRGSYFFSSIPCPFQPRNHAVNNRLHFMSG